VVVVVIKGRENARKRERRRKKEAEKDLSPAASASWHD
jgi:hypothetical protein